MSRMSPQVVDLGYELSSRVGKTLINTYGKTSDLKSILQYSFFNVFLISIVLLNAYIFETGSLGLSAFSLVMTGILGSRIFRGFENLVHEASHWNLSRRHRSLNEFIGDRLCGSASMNILNEYRDDHDQHHLYFGTQNDPDYLKFNLTGVSQLPLLASKRDYPNMIRVALRYWKAHFCRLTNPRILKRYLLWNSLCVVVPCLILAPLVQGSPLVILLGTGAVLGFSPFVRLVAEASEHDYLNVKNTFDSTYTNLGPREFFFPLNDSFHLLHHLIPTIPFWALRKANHELASQDLETFGLKSKKRGPEAHFFGRPVLNGPGLS